MENDRSKNPIHVLHVLGGLNRGGAETLVMKYMAFAKERGYQFDFAIHHAEMDAYIPLAKEMGASVYVVPRFSLFHIPSYKKWWRDFYASHPEIRIVHGHAPAPSGYYLSEAKKKGLVTICHAHSPFKGSGIEGIVRRYILRKAIRNSDFFMGCSAWANESRFGQEIASSSRCVVLKNAIDLDAFDFNPVLREGIRNELGVKPETLLLGTVARMEAVKNPLLSLEMLASLLKREIDARFLWVGDGTMHDKIVERAKELGISERLILVGSVANPERYDHALDVFLIPSTYEGLGISLIEAQASGALCFCSDRVPEEATVTSASHRISLSASADEWANAIISALAENGNAPRRGRANELREHGYDLKESAPKLFDIYDCLIEEE